MQDEEGRQRPVQHQQSVQSKTENEQTNTKNKNEKPALSSGKKMPATTTLKVSYEKTSRLFSNNLNILQSQFLEQQEQEQQQITQLQQLQRQHQQQIQEQPKLTFPSIKNDNFILMRRPELQEKTKKSRITLIMRGKTEDNNPFAELNHNFINDNNFFMEPNLTNNHDQSTEQPNNNNKQPKLSEKPSEDNKKQKKKKKKNGNTRFLGEKAENKGFNPTEPFDVLESNNLNQLQLLQQHLVQPVAPSLNSVPQKRVLQQPNMTQQQRTKQLQQQQLQAKNNSTPNHAKNPHISSNSSFVPVNIELKLSSNEIADSFQHEYPIFQFRPPAEGEIYPALDPNMSIDQPQQVPIPDSYMIELPPNYIEEMKYRGAQPNTRILDNIKQSKFSKFPELLMKKNSNSPTPNSHQNYSNFANEMQNSSASNTPTNLKKDPSISNLRKDVTLQTSSTPSLFHNNMIPTETKDNNIKTVDVVDRRFKKLSSIVPGQERSLPNLKSLLEGPDELVGGTNFVMKDMTDNEMTQHLFENDLFDDINVNEVSKLPKRPTKNSNDNNNIDPTKAAQIKRFIQATSQNSKFGEDVVSYIHSKNNKRMSIIEREIGSHNKNKEYPRSHSTNEVVAPSSKKRNTKFNRKKDVQLDAKTRLKPQGNNPTNIDSKRNSQEDILDHNFPFPIETDEYDFESETEMIIRHEEKFSQRKDFLPNMEMDNTDFHGFDKQRAILDREHEEESVSEMNDREIMDLSPISRRVNFENNNNNEPSPKKTNKNSKKPNIVYGNQNPRTLDNEEEKLDISISGVGLVGKSELNDNDVKFGSNESPQLQNLTPQTSPSPASLKQTNAKSSDKKKTSPSSGNNTKVKIKPNPDETIDQESPIFQKEVVVMRDGEIKSISNPNNNIHLSGKSGPLNKSKGLFQSVIVTSKNKIKTPNENSTSTDCVLPNVSKSHDQQRKGSYYSGKDLKMQEYLRNKMQMKLENERRRRPQSMLVATSSPYFKEGDECSTNINDNSVNNGNKINTTNKKKKNFEAIVKLPQNNKNKENNPSLKLKKTENIVKLEPLKERAIKKDKNNASVVKMVYHKEAKHKKRQKNDQKAEESSNDDDENENEEEFPIIEDDMDQAEVELFEKLRNKRKQNLNIPSEEQQNHLKKGKENEEISVYAYEDSTKEGADTYRSYQDFTQYAQQESKKNNYHKPKRRKGKQQNERDEEKQKVVLSLNNNIKIDIVNNSTSVTHSATNFDEKGEADKFSHCITRPSLLAIATAIDDNNNVNNGEVPKASDTIVPLLSN